MMAAKVPAPNMMIRAIFSLPDRLIRPSVLIGNAKIQMSVMMLKPEVAVHVSGGSPEAFTRRDYGKQTYSRRMLWYLCRSQA